MGRHLLRGDRPPRRHPRDRHGGVSCRPLECRNAAFTTANRDPLSDELAHIDAHLTRAPALPPYLQHTLASRREAIAAFLAESQRARQ
jgi:hypothetical protein